MNTKEYIQSQSFKGILIGICIAIVALVIFQAGVAFGERRANFADRFGDNFERNFRGPEEGRMFRELPGRGSMPNSNGAVGEVISIELPNILVAGQDNLEKTIVINSETIIREFQTERSANDIEVGDHIITIGRPNEEGQIEARLIRLLPPPPDGLSGSATGTPSNTENR